MKALIDPQTSISYVTSWSKHINNYYPVYTEIPNSARVCQVEPDDQIFDVADPQFWESCPSEIVAGIYYFDMDTKQFSLVPSPAPMPNENQPNVVGAQTI